MKARRLLRYERWAHQLCHCFLLCLPQENPALLGGMIVEIGDYRMDLSAATRQAKLRAHILDGLSA